MNESKPRTEPFTKQACSNYTVFIFTSVFVLFFSNCLQAAETQADRFKRFIESPPRIKSLVFSQEISGITTNFCRLKWQQNALWFGRSASNLFHIQDLEETKLYSLIVARFENKTYVFNGTELYSWTNKNGIDTNYNSAKATFDQVVSGQIADILNMGCQLAAVESIKWDGNNFETDNRAKELFIRGNLELDKLDRPLKLHVEQYPIRPRTNKQKAGPPWDYEYLYDAAPLLGYLPSQIIASFKNDDGTVGMSIRYALASVEISSVILPESEFGLELNQFTSSVRPVTVANGSLIYADRGRTVTVKEAPPPSTDTLMRRQSIRYVLAFLFLATLIVPIAFLRLGRRRIDKQP